MIHQTSIRAVCAVALLVLSASSASAQQRPELRADVSVGRPAHVEHHPRVAIDEAHNNFHTLGNRFLPFAKLMKSDGCEVVANKVPFTAESLARLDVLVIANAGGDDSNEPMFTGAEIHALEAWVSGGGALLLIADHAPYGRLAMDVAARFGVEMRNCYTLDKDHAFGGQVTHIAYTVENGRLADHPITRGRDQAERIGRAVTYTGQSLSVPENATPILELGENAVDRVYGLRDGRPVITGTPSAVSHCHA